MHIQSKNACDYHFIVHRSQLKLHETWDITSSVEKTYMMGVVITRETSNPPYLHDSQVCTEQSVKMYKCTLVSNQAKIVTIVVYVHAALSMRNGGEHRSRSTGKSACTALTAVPSPHYRPPAKNSARCVREHNMCNTTIEQGMGISDQSTRVQCSSRGHTEH